MDSELRLRNALTTAHRTIPFYAKRGIAIDEGAPGLELLRSVPLLFRKDLRVNLPKAWVDSTLDAKALLAAGELVALEAGESGRVLFRRGSFESERRGALSSNDRTRPFVADTAKRALLSVPTRGIGSCHSGDPSFEERREGSLLFLNSRQDPTFWTELVMDRMLDELALHETEVLEGDPFYLSVLSRHAAQRGRTLDVSHHVLFNFAHATSLHVAHVRNVFDRAILRTVSSPEIPFFLIENEDSTFRECSPSTFLEYLPAKTASAEGGELALVVATTLDRTVQPLLRFVTGELVQRGQGGSIVSVEGNLAEAIVLPSGGIVTVGALDRALATVPELVGFRAKQSAPNAIQLDVQGASPAAARDAIAALLPGIDIDARSASAHPAEPNGRFKCVERTIPLSLSATFHGCEGVAP